VPIVRYGNNMIDFTISEEPPSVKILNQTYIKIYCHKLQAVNVALYDGFKYVELMPTSKVLIDDPEELRLGCSKVYVYFENASKIVLDAWLKIREDYYVHIFGKKIRVTLLVTHPISVHCSYHKVITKNDSGRWIGISVKYRIS